MAEFKNVVILRTNQFTKDLKMAGYGDIIKPVGGMLMNHIITHRIYLKKKGTKGTMIARLVDSPNHGKTEGILMLDKTGIVNAEK